jgi:hypothetical protein
MLPLYGIRSVMGCNQTVGKSAGTGFPVEKASKTVSAQGANWLLEALAAYGGGMGL